MRVQIATAIVLSLAWSQQQRGVVSHVTAAPGDGVGVVKFTVTGTNPCGAVFLDYGDNVGITYPIRELPMSASHEYTKVGTFTVKARGMGNCDGETSTTTKVDTVKPQPPPPPPPAPAPATPPPSRSTQPPPAPVPPAQPNQPNQPGRPGRPDSSAAAMRFGDMDRNRDGVISRSEWTGSDQSFRVHDWNNDGRLSGDEVRLGAQQPAPRGGRQSSGLMDWSENRFRQLDRNGDNRVSRAEWRDDVEEFIRVDRNGDGMLSLNEFIGGDVDDDRGDSFDNLDQNGNNRIERNEWHGSLDTFRWLDRNNDGVLSRTEVVGTDFSTGGRTNPGSDVGGRAGGRSDQGRTSGRGGAVNGRGGGQNADAILVDSAQDWTDTGIDVRAGDVVTFRATGSIQLSNNTDDVAEPQGARSGRLIPNGPLPRAAAGALIARIGQTAAFLVGSSTDAIRMPRDGRLYLGVNDDFVRDNRGDFRVTVTIGRQ